MKSYVLEFKPLFSGVQKEINSLRTDNPFVYIQFKNKAS